MSKRTKILIIEDEPLLLTCLNDYLLRQYDVLAAMDGVTGLQIMYEELPDLVLLDLMLPRMDGFEVLENAKKDPVLKDIPVVILSALSSDKNIKRGLALGADKYLVKPEVDLKKVLRTIEEVINK